MTTPLGPRRIVVAAPISATSATSQTSQFAPAGVSSADATRAANILQDLLFDCLDLYLVAKQAHWNVTGPAFIGVHKDVLDPLAAMAADMADEDAERIATLGGTPIGTADALAAGRSSGSYHLLRSDTQAQLRAVDGVVSGLVLQLRAAIGLLGDCDVVSQNMVLGQAQELEKLQWFIRAHLEDSSGHLPGA